MPDNPIIACWSNNLAYPVGSLAQWLELVQAQFEKAHADGVQLLLLPEYACTQWLHYAPKDLSDGTEIPWLAEQRELALPLLKALSDEYQIALLAGTMPVAKGSQLFNRAHLFLNNTIIKQDKLCLTPAEQESDGWQLNSGATLTLFNWQGWRVAIVICLDIELPALAARLAPYQPDLILVPSMTSRGGYWRVNSCAKARAVELFTSVCTVGCYGRPNHRHLAYRGGINAYMPCEQTLGLDGILAESVTREGDEHAGHYICLPELPLTTIAQLRRRPEVWPGAWRADHVVIKE